MYAVQVTNHWPTTGRSSKKLLRGNNKRPLMFNMREDAQDVAIHMSNAVNKMFLNLFEHNTKFAVVVRNDLNATE